MIDWSRVSELKAEIGEDAFAEVVELFLDEVETVLARIGRCRTRAALAEEMHFLKGSAWNLGFREFGAVCQDGERRAAAAGSDPDLERLFDSYGQSKAAFLAGLGRHAAPSAA